jgi:hypothetical protein
MTAGTTFKVVCKGSFTNPPLLGVSENSFSIQILGPQGCAISSNTQDVLLNMTEVPPIGLFTVTPSDSTNGALSNYKFMITSSPYQIKGTDAFIIKFPAETVLPSNVSCTQNGYSYSSINCTSPQKNVLRVQLADAKDQLHTFTVNKVRNPNSTRSSSAFEATVVNPKGRVMFMYPYADVNVKNTILSSGNGTFVQADKNLNTSTEFNIVYIPSLPLPANASFQIYFPYTLGILLPLSLRVCEITIGTTKYPMTCRSDPFTFTIYLLEGMTVSVLPGTKVNIRVGNVTNADIQPSGKVDSIQITSFLDKNQVDAIDKVSSGLIP